MDRRVVMSLVAFAAVALGACGGGGDEDEVGQPASERPEPDGVRPPPAVRISWQEALELIQECEVKSVSQSHSLVVGLSLKDGSSHTTTEPYIDAVFDETDKASHCPPLFKVTE